MIKINPTRKIKKHKLFSITKRSDYDEFLKDYIFTDEELTILELCVIKGYTYNQIAEKINLTEATIKFKMGKIMNKLS